MNSKKAKKLRRLANAISVNQPKEKVDSIYKRLKSIHKENQKNGNKRIS